MAEGTQILQKYGTQIVLGATLLIGTASFLYNDYNSPQNKMYRKAQIDKKESREKSEDLVINFFMELLTENPDTTLENAILSFENAEPEVTLQEFAQKKQRSYQMYIEAYQVYYNTAKSKQKNK